MKLFVPITHGARFASFVLGLALALSCAPPQELDPDAGPPENAIYPIQTDPQQGEENVLVDKVIRLTYPNHIDSTTLSQGRLDLYSGPLNYWVRFFYDPVRMQLVVWPSRSLRMDATWVLAVGENVMDIDGAPVAFGDILSFNTGSEAGDNIPYLVPSFENDILPIFRSHCSTCHSQGQNDGFSDLHLNSLEEIALTAIGEESYGWPGRPRIAAYMPGNSYLLYKIIGDERIAGTAMPRTADLDSAADPIPLHQQELLVDWIASGAKFFDSETSQD